MIKTVPIILLIVFLAITMALVMFRSKAFRASDIVGAINNNDTSKVRMLWSAKNIKSNAEIGSFFKSVQTGLPKGIDLVQNYSDLEYSKDQMRYAVATLGDPDMDVPGVSFTAETFYFKSGDEIEGRMVLAVDSDGQDSCRAAIDHSSVGIN